MRVFSILAPFENYRTVPRDSFVLITLLVVISCICCQQSISVGLAVGGFVGIGSYLSIMVMVSFFMGLTPAKLKWVFPLFFILKYSLLIAILYYTVSSPLVNILGFFAGFSTIFIVIVFKSLLNLRHLFTPTENNMGSS